MKKSMICILISFYSGFCFCTYSGMEEPLKIKGFYIGMSKSDVLQVFKKLQEDNVAEHISLESENFRDVIMLDNEFSSTGNKIDIIYDESGKVTGITFQYKTVNILFDCSKKSAEEFVRSLTTTYDLPEMEMKDMGVVKSWKCKSDNLGIQILVDDSKNLRIQKLSAT